MVKIAPSILSADFANLERDIHRIADADYVHVDVMDGVFVPNISIGIPVVQSIRKVTELPLDVHLMITQPVRYVEQFCDAGADLVVGSHPHVLQGFETYKGKLIAYSLGNFLFSNSTNPTVLLQVHINLRFHLTEAPGHRQ